jgi:hypothetical protein
MIGAYALRQGSTATPFSGSAALGHKARPRGLSGWTGVMGDRGGVRGPSIDTDMEEGVGLTASLHWPVRLGSHCLSITSYQSYDYHFPPASRTWTPLLDDRETWPRPP